MSNYALIGLGIVTRTVQCRWVFADSVTAQTWLIERHGFLTPEAFQQNQLQAVQIAV